MSSLPSNRFLLSFALAVGFGAASTSAHPLVNAGFDDPSPGLGPVGGFGQVVGPPFDDGEWGAENASIVLTGGTNGPVTPRSPLNMLEMRTSGVVTQAWQVINVAGDLPATNAHVGLSAWFTVSANSGGTNAAVRLYTFGPGQDWSTGPSGTFSQTGILDGASHTWEQISLAPVPIPSNTQWVLAEVYYVSQDLFNRQTNGFVDDVEFAIVPEPASLSVIGMSCALVLRRRRCGSRS